MNTITGSGAEIFQIDGLRMAGAKPGTPDQKIG